jgi:hypothetical protein
MVRAGVFVGLFGALSGGCLPDRAGSHHAPDPGSAVPPLDLSGDLPLPPAYAVDPLWASAEHGNDFDLARLGRQEGAESLLTALRLGGRLGRTALDALAYAHDRSLVLGRSCELATHSAPATTTLLLASILEILENAPRTEETVDASGSAACITSLRQLSERQGQSPTDHDLAQSALSRLETPPPLVAPGR